MREGYAISCEKDYVSKTLTEIFGLLREIQPSRTYAGDWHQAIELRNSIQRIIKDYEEAHCRGYPWAEWLAPEKIIPGWGKYVQFSNDIDARRSTFIQCYENIVGYFEYLANQFEVADPGLSSEIRAKIRNVEPLKSQYIEPLTYQKSIIRL